jgi:hypothetical protein
MTEIERLEKALAAVTIRFNAIAGLMDRTAAEREIESILNPVEYEEVEETVGWLNVYPSGYARGNRISAWATKDDADKHADDLNRISCQEIKVKVHREKVAPVERSVTATDVEWRDSSCNVVPCFGKRENWNWTDLIGKRGVLTFTWQEDPPK